VSKRLCTCLQRTPEGCTKLSPRENQPSATCTAKRITPEDGSRCPPREAVTRHRFRGHETTEQNIRTFDRWSLSTVSDRRRQAGLATPHVHCGSKVEAPDVRKNAMTNSRQTGKAAILPALAAVIRGEVSKCSCQIKIKRTH